MDLGTIVSDSFEAYQNFRTNSPYISAMLTAELTFLTGDAISQFIEDRKVDSRKLKYTAALAPLYGLGIEGLINSGEVVGEHISNNALIMAALGPNLFGNPFNAFFFVNNTVGERENYNLKALGKNYYEFAKAFVPGVKEASTVTKAFKEKIVDNIPMKEFGYSVLATLTVWNGIQYVNYEYISEEMRTPFSMSVSMAWTGLLSWWSLKGRRRVVETETISS